MTSTISWTSPALDQLPPVLSACASWSVLLPLNLDYGRSHRDDPVVPVTFIQSCTGFLTSTYIPTTQTFTVSLQNSAWDTRTQTVTGTTETWTNTFVRIYTSEVENTFFTGDGTSISSWLSGSSFATNLSRSVIFSTEWFP